LLEDGGECDVCVELSRVGFSENQIEKNLLISGKLTFGASVERTVEMAVKRMLLWLLISPKRSCNILTGQNSQKW
jgi:hypothetical protein